MTDKQLETSSPEPTNRRLSWRSLPRNVWAVSLTSFFMDISSEMVINILPLFLSNVLGVGTNIIGLIEGIIYLTKSDEEFVETFGAAKHRLGLGPSHAPRVIHVQATEIT